MVKQGKLGGNLEDATAKHIFDRIGKKVQAKAEVASKKYYDDLHGTLSKATFEKKPEGTQTLGNPCDLNHEYHTNATNGKSYPCRTGTEKRFSEVSGGECDDKKIEGNDRKNGGACAPYRRLHLCVRNLENINRYDKINNHTLLADVCLAALHEGAAISADHGQYQQTNSYSQICTMLARSFADIGDIIRGKDLYRGNNGKDKLQDNLKRIFQQIHKEVTSTSGKNKDALQARYKDDKENFFKLREDWWYANRGTVWYAITCGAGQNDKYFRRTCSNDTKETDKKCRCPSYKVPTYFDYVPQYLRWFEEWGEEFCRLRKHKLENAINKCRGDSGNDRYCDLNGYNCEKTIRVKKKLVEGADCKKCTVPCDNFVHWIDNQQKEFEKQKKKYGNEIKKAEEKKETSNGNISNIYEKDFYRNLKEHYNDVDEFLKKLNDESICKKPPQVGTEKADHVDFTKHPDETFAHTTYCQACPWCGTDVLADGKWKAKGDGECANEVTKKYNEEDTTDISILSTDRGKTKILEKLGVFCRNGENIKKDDWKCHYEKNDEHDGSGDSNICVLQNDKIGKKEEKSMHYHPFFWKWVTEMLIDSMYWRKELKSCINNETKACKNGCKNNCDCYKRWVQEKKKEFEGIKQHFGKQGDLVKQIGAAYIGIILENVLDIDELLQNIKDTYGNAKETEHIKDLLDEEKKKNQVEAAPGAVTENKNTIDLLIDHEKGEADKCVENNPESACEKKAKPPTSALARSETPSGEPSHNDDHHDDLHDKDIDQRHLNIEDEEGKQPDFNDHQDEDDDDDDEGGGGEDVGAEDQENKGDSPQEVPPTPATTDTTTPLDVCATVAKALTIDTLQAACPTKYVNGREKFPKWKCIPSGNNTTTTGSICVPPRRRKLYVGELTKWAETVGDTATQPQGGEKSPQASGKAQPQPQASDSSQANGVSTETPESSLLHAFVKSAAIETFFLWDRYKKIKDKEKKDREGFTSSLLVQEGSQEVDPEHPQKQLNSGNIPIDFLRQMFYTLGDYRDILYSGNKDAKNGFNYIFSGDKEMKEKEEKIKGAIQKFFEQSGNNQKSGSSPSPSVEKTTPKEWWKTNGEHIWNAMVCALTYKDNDAKGKSTALQQIEDAEKILEQLKGKYGDYNSVKLEDTSGTSPTQAPASGDNTPTTLTDFISRPPYFRYLEEWGQNFCKERKKRLEEVKKECRGEFKGQKYCGGDGHDCTEEKRSYNNMFADLFCRPCYEQCRKYKKWIDIKFEEFKEQQNKYGNELQKLNGNSNGGGDNNCCTEIKEKKTAPDFLKALKHCKNSEDDTDKSEEDEKNKIDFSNPQKMFNPSTYCKACPIYGVKCNSGGRGGRGGTNGCTKNTEPANQKSAEGVATPITILINDGSTDVTDKQLEEKCKEYGLYKDLRKQQWECQKQKDEIYQCNIINTVDHEHYDDKIPFNILFQRWLIDFIQYYNKSKESITRCTNNVTSCKEGCNNKCNCVQEWLNKKSAEWKTIKEYYNQHFKDKDERIDSRIKSFFEQGTFSSDAEEAKKVVDEENKRDELWGCTGKNLENGNEKNCNKGDFITNLISKLQNKIHECKTKHDETPPNTCDDFPTQTYIEPLDPDSPDDHMHHIQQPNFCPPPETPLTCVERAAKQLREEAEGKVSDELKGSGLELKEICNKVQKNGAIGKNSCDFKTTYENSVNNINNKCKDNRMERFKIGKKWNSKYIGTIRKDLYIPPRREYMCLDDLSMLGRSTVNDSSALLKKVQEAAKREGDDIIKKLLEQNSCDEHRICDAMKYSFADLGDIIRGRDLWNKNSKQKGLESRLRSAFENIYKNVSDNKKHIYKKGIPHYIELRSDWWDVNRKDIWNAMTCNAPKDAKLNKRNEEPEGISTDASYLSTLENCAYDKDPPDYDYIPQPFRWMQEWSETFCKLLNEQMKQFETECKDCKNNGVSCKDDVTGTKCEKCKKQCKNYQELIDKWKLEFDKYNDIYKEIFNNNKAKISSEKYFKNFVDKLRTQCNEPNSADKYLDIASHCTKYKFTESHNKNNDNYAFKHTPKDFEQACKCEAPDPLDNCPKDNKHVSVCKNLSPTRSCESKTFNNDDDSWTSVDVKDSKGKNHGVLVPPRRRQLCIRNMNRNLDTINNISDFKKIFLQYVYTEGYYLWHKYKNDNKNALDAMHYSFYDYGDIVKGTDLISTTLMDKLKTKLDDLLKENDANKISDDRKKWWFENKKRVWHAMLCGYKSQSNSEMLDQNWCTLPNDDNTDQFLRWFREWSEHFCDRRQKLYEEVQKKCVSAKCNNDNGKIDNVNCEGACVQYKNYIIRKREEYRLLIHQYNVNYKEQKAEGKNTPEYFNAKCNSKCNCLSEHIDNETKWKNIYDSLQNSDLKNKCDCIKIKPTYFPKNNKPKDETAPIEPKQEDQIQPPEPPLPPADQPFDPTILQTTIPLGIALALGSIAFFFMKKKTKSSVDLLRVINIPKGDYDIPTKLSPNRYIPYTSGKYRGKRYIYLEGDSGTDSGYTDHYSDITSSSESEYEEMDINDIYVPGSPKYKTLIEVVLEPSGKNTTASGKNTPSDTQNDIQNDDIPSSKITDNEWNTLKHDFISNMLQNTQNTEPNMLGYNVDNNTNPKTLHVSMDEKPFIMSIHDRNLYTGEEISYNINMSTNSMDDTKYVSNNVYSGIDLINDTLSGNQHIDIYDEVLKRKENELFGTNHVKQTSIHSVAKLTNSDPILNQINLFHTWLDRHRDMCEQWNNKEEVLDKLKEKWENETHSGNTHPSDSNKTLNTDVSIQIHMDNPKPINQFTNMDTILEDLEKYNEPYYDVQDDIYYDVNDDNDISTVDTNAMDVPSKVQIEMDVNTKLVKEKYPIADVWDI